MRLRLMLVAAAVCCLVVSARAQAPAVVLLHPSPYFCCGFGSETDRQAFSNNLLEFRYDSAACNRPGALGVHLVGTRVTFDDPLHEDKVCDVDALPLLAGLTPGMWDISTSMAWTVAPTRTGWGSSRSAPFPVGGFVPTSAPPPVSAFYPVTTITAWPWQSAVLGYAMVVDGYISVAWSAANCDRPGQPGASVNAARTEITYDDPMHNDRVCVVDATRLIAALPNGDWHLAVQHAWPLPDEVFTAYGVPKRGQPTARFSDGQFTVDGSAVPPPVVPPPTPPPIATGPECLAPLGAHAAAITLTGIELTTGRPGSRSKLNFQLGGQDAVREVGLLIDGVEQVTLRGAELTVGTGVWFVQPPAGSHDIKVRVLNSYGCALTRTYSRPLVVQ